MSDRATAANPDILRWARSRAGLTLIEVAGRFSNKSAEDIRAWEQGESAPTFIQLERLANTVYKRPVALFFFPEPPDEEPLEREFRTLPETTLADIPPEVRFELQRARSFLYSIEELSGGENPAERQIWRDLEVSVTEDIQNLADKIREYLGISLRTQKGWASTRTAMSNWRQAVESVGVFIFKHNFGTENVSGFCIYHSDFPVIMINNQNTFTRQIFTLFHELAHILFGLSGVTPEDLGYAQRIRDTVSRRIETVCNELAAEILIPSESFPLHRFPTSLGEKQLVKQVTTIARSYNVSREVILRRLLDVGLVEESVYDELSQKWSSQRTHGGDGGSYYNNQKAYLGNAYVNLAFSQYYSGQLSIGELAEHLGMKARTVEEFEARGLVGDR